MAPDFGAEGDSRKGAVSGDLDCVGDFGLEGGDEEGGGVGEVRDAGDGGKKVPIQELFLGCPDVDTVLVRDGVLVWVVPSFLSTRWRGEKVGVVLSLGEYVGGLGEWDVDVDVGL